MELEFKKQSKIKGIDRGYYFKGEFLSRYKFEAIGILRKRIEEAGEKIGDKSKTSFEKGRETLPDEWQVVHNEWLKGEERNKKTHEKKKPYFDKLHINSLKHRLLTLQNKIEMINIKKQDVEKLFSDKIDKIKAEMQELSNLINQGQELENG